MNKFITTFGVILLSLILISWYFYQNNTVSYTADFTKEIAELEQELSNLETEVINGTLTPEKAGDAQIKITNRLNTINSDIESLNKATLTPKQRTQLLEGLYTLSHILKKYNHIFVSIDNEVMNLPKNKQTKATSTPPGAGIVSAGRKVLVENIEDSIKQIEEMNEEVNINIETDTETEAEQNDAVLDTEISNETNIADDEEIVDDQENESETEVDSSEESTTSPSDSIKEVDTENDTSI